MTGSASADSADRGGGTGSALVEQLEALLAKRQELVGQFAQLVRSPDEVSHRRVRVLQDELQRLAGEVDRLLPSVEAMVGRPEGPRLGREERPAP